MTDIEDREREEDLVYPTYALRAPNNDDDDDCTGGVINAIALRSRFRHHLDFDDNLPMVFGSETELGFHFGKIVDKVKLQSSSGYPEAVYPYFLRAIANMTGAFARDPADPWLRKELNHYDSHLAKSLASAAAEDDSRKIADEKLRERLNRARLSARDFYMGEVGVFLPNGSRLYVDGAHMEYSIAECRDPKDVICLEKAMESLILQVKDGIEDYNGRQIFILKDNSDRKGNSFACHTNFLLGRKFFRELYKGAMWSYAWASFLVTSIIYTGAGKVGSERGGDPCDYQISQRADHFSRMIGADTMSQRPIINYRGEALADDEKWGRFHVILHDSNMAEWPIYLKMGVQAIVLNMMQAHYYNRILDDTYTKYILYSPVYSLPRVSRDLTCKNPLQLEVGSAVNSASPIQIQKVWYECTRRFYENRYHYPHWVYGVLDRWGKILEWLEEDNSKLDKILDWRIKKKLRDSYIAKRLEQGKPVSPTDGNVGNIDGFYHDLGPNGFYNRSLKAGQVERIVSDGDIFRARDNAPEDTRAFARSQFIKRYLDQLLDVSWEMVAFRMDWGDGTDLVVKVDLAPLKGTRWRVQDMFDRHPDIKSFSRNYIERFLMGESPF